FFSCRRRHTRSKRDWSSDVCSSDLERDDTTAACPGCKPSRTTRPNHYRRGSSTARGYDERWRRLSVQARRLSPQCADCGSVEDRSEERRVGKEWRWEGSEKDAEWDV